MDRSSRDGMDFLQDVAEFGEETRPAISNEVIEALREIGLSFGERTDDPIAWQLMGHCLEELGDGSKAQRCYARAARQLVRSGRAASEARVPHEPRHATRALFEPLPFAVFQDIRVTRDH